MNKRKAREGLQYGKQDTALNDIECIGYKEGCCCIECINRWRATEFRLRTPRCIMCPALVNNIGEASDGVCGVQCADALHDIQTNYFYCLEPSEYSKQRGWYPLGMKWGAVPVKKRKKDEKTDK